MLSCNHASVLPKCLAWIKKSIRHGCPFRQRCSSLAAEPVCFDVIEDSEISERSNFLEEDVGILTFLNGHEGFYGEVKRKCSDFIVNEILGNLKIVRLTDLGSVEKHLKNTANPSNLQNEKILHILCDYLTKDAAESVVALYEKNNSEQLLVNINHLSKVKRNYLHTCFQKHFPKLNLKGITKENEKYFLLKHNQEASTADQLPPKEIHQSHLHFVLSKSNISSFDAFSEVCKILNIRLRHFHFGGLKDKRGTTCQLVSVDGKDVSPKKLAKVNYCHNIKVGNFNYQKKPVTLGDIYGNHFEILVRDVSTNISTIKTAIDNVQNNGFINYFGMQRFGAQGSTSFMLVGRKLLQKNWEEAVELILQPRNFVENSKLEECRNVWWRTRNPKAALNCLDYNFRFSREALLLKGLDVYGAKEYKAALKCIPKTFLQFYFNSYDSYLWNTVASKRIICHGQKVIEGDSLKHSTLKKNQDNNLNKVVTVKNSDLHVGELSFQDVVIPIFGQRVSLPINETGDMFRELLANDNLSEEIVNSHELYVKYGLYRHIVALPENLKWSIIQYDDADQSILQTDYDKVRQNEPYVYPETGKRKAVKVEFDLKSSCYATMALREIMKTQLLQ